ncbi:MAG: prepilin-type N-terminal cleavage/methylation domain-containing protein [Nitrospinae bacterium]|nr:prepilin-type N-terminal cleavage/methylation domain-containing protein [Nitrospinota bacterium]
MRTFGGGQGGLTLIEVLIALAISTLILGWAWGLYSNGMHAYQHGLREVAVTQEARSVLGLMIRDIQRVRPEGGSDGLKGLKPGGVSPVRQPGEIDRLQLTTAVYPAAMPNLTPAERTPTLQRIRYFLAPAAGGKLALKRAVAPLGRDGMARVMSLSEQVQELDLRYFDGQAWHDDWQRPTLPRALEIAVVLQDSGRGARPHRFATLVALE